MLTPDRTNGGDDQLSDTADSPIPHLVDEMRATLGKMQNPVRGFLHGFAAVGAVTGTVLLVLQARSLLPRLAVLVFGLGLVALYSTSSLYHSVPWRELWKRRMQRADHSMIFVLIAGTYTPIAVIALEGWLRWATLATVWAIAITGIATLAFMRKDRYHFAIALMTTLGWLALVILWPVGQRAGIAAVVLLAAGGVIYTIGMVFLVTNRPRLWPRVFSYHEVFHIMVIAASVLHFVATYRYVVPLAS